MGGWWWGSQSASSSVQPKTTQDASQSHIAADKAESCQPLSRDEQSLADLRALFTSIDPERAAAATAAVQSKSEARALLGRGEANEEDEDDSLYPASMKCAACFDQAYYCSSLGGQLTNIYRYGGMRSCTDLWAQWRFCMRTKAMGAEERRERIREWEQRKVVKYKIGRSSEDVWTVREVPLERPFAKDLDKSDEEQMVLKAQC